MGRASGLPLLAREVGEGEEQIAHLTCSIGFTCYPAGLGDLERLSLEQVVNLADENKSLFTSSSQFILVEVPMRPRTIGGRFGYSFGGK